MDHFSPPSLPVLQFDLDLSKVARLGGHSQPRTHRGGAQFPGMMITYAQMGKSLSLFFSPCFVEPLS